MGPLTMNDAANLMEPDLREQKGIIISILTNFADDAYRLISYLDHIGFDHCALTSPRDLEAAVLGHYRVKVGRYDVDRACNDLATWPPIATRIAELMSKKSKGLPNDL
jgi:hypothetical protein